MAATEGTKTPIEPGLIARIAAGVRYTITGQAPDWFGPGDPLAPVAQEQAVGRRYDYPVFRNTRIAPRNTESVSFAQMRALADSCDVLRLVIETRKDQVARLTWTIKSKNEQTAPDATCGEIAAFLAMPDKEHRWGGWLRMLLEDLFVMDAPCIYARHTIGGQLYSLDAIDGSTIEPKIDESGRRPVPPLPAYQQVLKGLPAVDYTSDEIIYAPRNPRTHKIYGYSPVEQIIMTVNIALRRALHQLQYYTEGNIPEAIIGVPESWNPDQIRQFQDYWDAMLEGNTAEKRHAKFIPGGLKFQETKGGALKDTYDEWLARIVCFAFSISPQPFVAQMNRATAETAQEAAIAEGLAPIMVWIKGLIDTVICKYFARPDLEFCWEEETVLQPEIKEKIVDSKVRSGRMTINEARDDDGLDPVEGGDELMIFTAAGAVLLKDVINPPEPPAPIIMQHPGAPPSAEPPSGTGEPKEPPADPDKDKEALGKAKKSIAPIDQERAAIVRERTKLQKVVGAFLAEKRKDVVSQVIDLVGKGEETPEDKLQRILDELNLQGWSSLADDVVDLLEEITKDGSYEALAQIGMSDADAELISLVNDKAVAYAEERAGELVGMKRVDGEWIENPTAKWAITDSTREMIRGDVARAMEEGMSNDELADLLTENYAFSDERAEMIARTETAFADTRGNMIAYRESGLVDKKEWATGAGCCELCGELDGKVVDLDEDFPNGGGDGAPLHPGCRCATLPVLKDNNESEE